MKGLLARSLPQLVVEAVALAGAVCLAFVALNSARAQEGCPVGKSEIVITTPSGKVKTLCIADKAVGGLENAADHAEGTIIPTGCPCFTQAGVDAELAANPGSSCFLTPGSTDITGGPCALLECVDSAFTELFRVVEGPPDREIEGKCEIAGHISAKTNNRCSPDPDGIGFLFLTEDEGDACRAILEPLSSLDTDNDLIADTIDNCPFDQNLDQADADLDEVGDLCDNCPAIANSDQADADMDGTGDVCEIT